MCILKIEWVFVSFKETSGKVNVISPKKSVLLAYITTKNVHITVNFPSSNTN
jgi:hypothetical protein